MDELFSIIVKPFSAYVSGNIHSSGFFDKVVKETPFSAGPETSAMDREKDSWFMLHITERCLSFVVSFMTIIAQKEEGAMGAMEYLSLWKRLVE